MDSSAPDEDLDSEQVTARRIKYNQRPGGENGIMICITMVKFTRILIQDGIYHPDRVQVVNRDIMVGVPNILFCSTCKRRKRLQ